MHAKNCMHRLMQIDAFLHSDKDEWKMF